MLRVQSVVTIETVFEWLRNQAYLVDSGGGKSYYVIDKRDFDRALTVLRRP